MDWIEEKPEFRRAVLLRRARAGMSMAAVAAEVGVGRSTLYRMIDPDASMVPFPLARRAARRFTGEVLGASQVGRPTSDTGD